MASPVYAHVAVLGVFSAGVWIVNLWKLLWAIYSLFHARSKCVCIPFIYIVVIVCKYENILQCVEASQCT